MIGRTKHKIKCRLSVVLAIIILWIVLISSRMVQLCIKQRDFLIEKAKEQHEMTVILNPKRGHIFDRKGQELAISIDVDSIYAIPPQITNMSFTAEKLADILPVESLTLLKLLKSERRFVWIKRKISPWQAEQVRDLKLQGVGLLKESKRFYPKKKLGSHIIGFVGMDNIGLEGLEHYFEAEIKGEPGKMLTYIDAKRRGVLPEGVLLREPTGGKGVILTIDEVIQHIAEEELQKAVQANSAKSGSVIVMDPNNGEILAMATVPTYDPNRFNHYPAYSRRNRAITDCFEPGSTFKIAMAAAALEYGVVRQEEPFDCSDGSIVLANHVVRDYRPFGQLSFKQIIMYSSNVGAIKVGKRLSKREYYEKLKEFGFGEKSGIDLPGESRGILRPHYEWSRASTGAISIGYEIAVTPLQLISFISAVANGGYLLKPKIANKITYPDGKGEKEFPVRIKRRIFSQTTAEILTKFMEGVVLTGTGKKAEIKGYRIAGKTGTAQKIGQSGGYSDSLYTASFVGFLPGSQPEITIIVVIDEPQLKYYGGAVAAPVFRKIATPVIRYLRISPDDTKFIMSMASKLPSRETKEYGLY